MVVDAEAEDCASMKSKSVALCSWARVGIAGSDGNSHVETLDGGMKHGLPLFQFKKAMCCFWRAPYSHQNWAPYSLH
jgi:hypothetical protein